MADFRIIIRLLALSEYFRWGGAGIEAKNSLKIASELKPLFLMKMTENGRFVRYKGFVKDFCEELANVLGYQYEIILPQEYHTQGNSNRPNSTVAGYWNGAFGMLIRNEVDLAFGDTEVTMERAQVVDFSMPVLTTRFSILYRANNLSFTSAVKDEKEQRQWIWTIFHPFPASVWIPFIVLAILYLGFIKLNKFRLHFIRFFPKEELRISKKLAIIFFTAWGLLLLTSYVSNYTALKVIAFGKGSSSLPQNIVDIVSNDDIKLGWIARGSVERFLRNTVNEIFQKVYMRNIGRDWVSSKSEGLNKVLTEKGKFALITDSLTADYETQQECSLYKLPHDFGPIRSISVATPIGSPLRERVNQAVLSLSEQGIIEVLKKRWFTHSNEKCSTTSENTAKFYRENASFQEMSPVFIMALVGLFLASLAAFLEMQLMRRKSKSTVVVSVMHEKVKPPRQHQLQQAVELLPKFNLEDV